jgi:hypothetical protein
MPDDLPPGEGTWIRVYTPAGMRWERIDEHGRTQAVWPPREERR